MQKTRCIYNDDVHMSANLFTVRYSRPNNGLLRSEKTTVTDRVNRQSANWNVYRTVQWTVH